MIITNCKKFCKIFQFSHSRTVYRSSECGSNTDDHCSYISLPLLFLFYFMDGNPTLGDCKRDNITVSIAKCDSIK
jgi:hypothetical protein